MTAILKASERLLSVAGRKAELLAELDVSLTMQAFWPEAFEHGHCSSFVTGSPYSPDKVKITIKRMDTEGNEVDRREWPPSEVPEELLARTHIRDALLQITNGRRHTRLKDHSFHSGIYLTQGD